MTLNHSRTWPVSTMAVVQLRVNVNSRTYSTLSDEDNNINPCVLISNVKVSSNSSDQKLQHDKAEQEVHHMRDTPEDKFSEDRTSKKTENRVILPLSKKHLELFTKMSSSIFKTLRTDTVSTILEQDEFDSENQGSIALCNPIISGVNESIDNNFENLEKFHVLALSRVEDDVRNTTRIGSIGRRASNKIENWDLIYTETNSSKFSKKSNENASIAPGTKIITTGVCNKFNECLLPDIPLDARKATTLRRHYYPEGGWGWVIIVCTVFVHVLNHGLQLSCSQLNMPASEKFKVPSMDVAGVDLIFEQVLDVSFWTVLFSQATGHHIYEVATVHLQYITNSFMHVVVDMACGRSISHERDQAGNPNGVICIVSEYDRKIP